MQFQIFQKLMHKRIRDVLLVASQYDLHIFDEDERLFELVHEQYKGLNLTHAPEFTRVTSGKEARALLNSEETFDLVIATSHLEDMSAEDFVRSIRKDSTKTPVVLLAFDLREISKFSDPPRQHLFNQIFLWQGDYKLILAIIKYFEDKLNVEDDTRLIGVQTIILVEDNIRYYSSFLPIIYEEVMKHSQRLITESMNQSHIQLRQRARPKILLCTTFEEAWAYFEKYHETILGVISDIGFPRNGKMDPQAGLELARNVKAMHQDIPILLHSNYSENKEKAEAIGATFLKKDSPTLLHELRTFMQTNLSFGDFVFRTPDGKECARAKDLISLERALETVPDESIIYHSERNHFSNWLKARTEFDLAFKLRPRKMSDYGSTESARQSLINALREYRHKQQKGIVTDFHRETYDPYSGISRIGSSSLGGKARGLAFLMTLMNRNEMIGHFGNTLVYIPAAVVISTDYFDEFIQLNNLHTFSLGNSNDQLIIHKFLAAEKYPNKFIEHLNILLEIEDGPLAVRSSSLLEDSRDQPFAGVYRTYMLPNRGTIHERRAQLLRAIKRVYASTFLSHAKHYIKATPFRLEEEKMAVIIQKLVGVAYGDRYYPCVSGVARSHNFYPIPPQKSTDGVVSIALGLGKTVVEGGSTVRFSPKHPQHTNMQGNIKNVLSDAQKSLYALNLKGSQPDESIDDKFVIKLPLSAAEEDGTLALVGSTYSHENNAIYEGVSRPGARLVTFASVLKRRDLPLAQICERILEVGSKGMGLPVEIEFAVNVSTKPNKPHHFAILQMRPMVISREMEALDVNRYQNNELICKSSQTLGNGVIEGIYDIVLVNRETFSRAKSREAAGYINKLNSKLLDQDRPYILIGVGRWGSLDPWLGIPVTWDMINGARAIVESDFVDISVSPSQGSHFFQNLTSFQVGYFTLNSRSDGNFLDWDWLLQHSPVEQHDAVLHLQFSAPITVKMNGRDNIGVITKPGIQK